MSKDKVPTLYNKPATAPARINQTHTPVREQTLFGKFVSGFMARLNTQTVERNIEEVQALTAFRKEQGKLADASLERDRKVEHYLKHRDDVILDDHEEHLDQMRANRLMRALAAEEREHQMRLAHERRQQELSKAQFASATTRFGLDTFNRSLPHRQEELEQKAKTGTLDAEIDMLMRVKDVAKERKPEKAPPPHVPQTDGLEKMLAELNQEIELAHRTQASDDVKSTLYAFRSRVSVLIEEEKNKSR